MHVLSFIKSEGNPIGEEQWITMSYCTVYIPQMQW